MRGGAGSWCSIPHALAGPGAQVSALMGVATASLHITWLLVLLAVARGSGGQPPAAFQFIARLAVPKSNASSATPELRGFHTVLADDSGSGSTEVFGCGIDGQLVAADFATPTNPVLGDVVSSESMLQSRTLLWDHQHRLVVANRDFLFYRYPATNSANRRARVPSFELVANITTALSGRSSRNPHGSLGGDNGINGAAIVSDLQGTVLLVGAAMPGLLVVAEVGSTPRSLGSCNMTAQPGPGLAMAMDIDQYQPAVDAVPLLVLVSAEDENLLAIMQLTASAHNTTFAAPEDWKAIGTLPASVLNKVGWSATGRGCNRVRVHAESKRAVFSCFGGGHGHASVGFVDLSKPAQPRLMAAVPFVTEQPTGMLVVGNVVFVAGGRDLMAFDMAATVGTSEPAPVLATCGAACAGIAHSPGQNLHSMSYRVQDRRHYLFMSAQIDNAIGAVEILDPGIIARLH